MAPGPKDIATITPSSVPVTTAVYATMADLEALQARVFYTYVQFANSDTWTIAHNLGYIPSVTVIDSTNEEVIGDVTHVDSNNVIISFSQPISGRANFS
jgi:hypothetical protein